MENTSQSRTVAELIDAFGGNAALARVIGKEPSTVSEMKRSGSVSVRYWPAIIDAAKTNPRLAWVTSEALMLMHAPDRNLTPTPTREVSQ